MSILIKGMEMPKNCGECRLCNNSGGAFELGNDYCCLTDLDVTDLDAIPNWCPLVPVPPHGRLIDADALELELKKRSNPVCDGWVYSVLRASITVIPAEEGAQCT